MSRSRCARIKAGRRAQQDTQRQTALLMEEIAAHERTDAALKKAKEAAEYAEQIKNLADKLGVTTKDLQEYQYAAVASGVSVEALNAYITANAATAEEVSS